MISMDEVMLALAFVVLPISAWGLICNERTYAEQIRRCDQAYMFNIRRISQGLFPIRSAYPADETYRQHFWRIFFLRRTDDLYRLPTE